MKRTKNAAPRIVKNAQSSPQGPRTRNTLVHFWQKSNKKRVDDQPKVQDREALPAMEIQRKKMDSRLDSILKVFTESSSSRGQDSPVDKTDFLDAVRSISLTTSGGAPWRHIYEQILKLIEVNSSLTTIACAMALLRQLQKRFPAVGTSEARGKVKVLQVNDEIWMPANRKAEDQPLPDSGTRASLRKQKEDVENVDLTNLALLVKVIAEDLDPPVKKETSVSGRSRANARTGAPKSDHSVGSTIDDVAIKAQVHSSMYSYLVGLITQDFCNRLAVFKGRRDVATLRDSVLGKLLSVLDFTDEYVLFWKHVVRIILGSTAQNDDILTCDSWNNNEGARNATADVEMEERGSQVEGESSLSGSGSGEHVGLDILGRGKGTGRRPYARVDSDADGGSEAGAKRRNKGRVRGTEVNEFSDMEQGGSQHTSGSSHGRVSGTSEQPAEGAHEESSVEYGVGRGELCRLSQTLIAIALDFYTEMERAGQYNSAINQRDNFMRTLLREWRSMLTLDEKEAFVKTMERPQHKLDFALAVFQDLAPKVLVAGMSSDGLPIGVKDLLLFVGEKTNLVAFKRKGSAGTALLAFIVAHAVEAQFATSLAGSPPSGEPPSAEQVTKAVEAIEKACGSSINPSTKLTLEATQAMAEVMATTSN